MKSATFLMKAALTDCLFFKSVLSLRNFSINVFRCPIIPTTSSKVCPRRERCGRSVLRTF